jgi:hypothetical protein
MPDGKRVGREYVAKNPTCADRRSGSFKVNLQTRPFLVALYRVRHFELEGRR